MKTFCIEKILKVVHWNNKLFSFYTTKNKNLRFNNGQFLLIGLNINKYYYLIIRAYSIVNPTYSKFFEFFSITIEKGTFTSLLKKIQSGDYILISKKSNGTLILDNIQNGKFLYFIATGTGLAPFISLIQDPSLYKRFNKIILIHGVSYINELSYKHFINKKNIYNEYINNKIKKHLIYYPTITRENYINKGRITELIIQGKLFKDLNLPYINFHYDKLMLCGNKNMLKEISEYLKKLGFKNSIINNPKDFVMEYSFIIQQNLKYKNE
ncbi:Ferredoxin--NADP reductase [Candidatus Portiera aleyrodidarum]|uniref:ferredoxin--NADP(+) reductase n=1 Tax=Candidatus Portiera aleyrodidarum TV TaxID=1297582 RepID=A0A8D3X8S1_9GAMM|nr:ferredoxin--NADP reductase [Candidatus Portiera aleyrodidarum]AGI27246.1 flavodoxin reductase family protein [Candidatus Portiera aleyrodidarum TV]CEI59239.1 Ferredoxin--NADP reductase [Candidatus Portiera aleyrodidarum]